MPAKALFVQGQPSTGKTHLVKHCSCLAAERGWNVVGFYTDEVLGGSSRIGFDIVTVPDGRRSELARKGKGQPRTGEYRVSVSSFEDLALPSIDTAAFGKTANVMVIIDEIGRMELHSSRFRDAVRELLDRTGGNVLVLGSIACPRYGHTVAFCEELKARPDVITINLKKSTRDEVRDLFEAALRDGFDSLAVDSSEHMVQVSSPPEKRDPKRRRVASSYHYHASEGP